MAEFPKLIVLTEKLRGLVFELNKDSMSAGRKEEQDICIKDGSISSHHCDFIHDESGYWIKDQDSTNGTRVNNVPVEPGTPVKLKNSDLIQLGYVEVLFDFNDGSTMAVSRTQTGIDLTSTEVGLSTVNKFSNLSPFAGDDGAAAKKKKLMMMVIGAVVGLLVLAGMIYVIIDLAKTKV